MKAALTLSLLASALAASKTSIRLQRYLESEESTDATTTVLLKFPVNIEELEATARNSEDPRTTVYEFLTSAAAENEARLDAILPPSVKKTSLWISGGVALSGVTKQTLKTLIAHRSISYIDLDAFEYSHPEVFEGKTSEQSEVDGAYEWGVEAIEAPSIWKWYTGKGAVVGSIDTGALHTHQAIRHNWRSELGWFDPYNKTALPWDSSGHGSHTIGTMVGAYGIGVAPGAKWISCMGLYKGMGSSEKLLQCAQFMLCPTKPDGTGADCKKGPHVVNNSWGGAGAYSPWMEDVVAAWKAAGIIPIFSNGNNGAGCATVGNPGGYKTVISVGAIGSYTNEKNLLAYFSSKGPQTKNGEPYIKPDLSAPGFYTRSVDISNTTTYKEIAGTSMAAPHVAGVVAIIKSVDPNLSYDKIYKYLTGTTDQKQLNTTEPLTWWSFQNKTVPGYPNCGGVQDTAWPNNRFGHGRLNVGTILRDGTLHDTRREGC